MNLCSEIVVVLKKARCGKLEWPEREKIQDELNLCYK